jgi:2-iminobutanoate/2-iminopropanoate deaminase
MSKPVGPYTPIVQAGPWLVASGQVGIKDGALVDGGMGSELQQALNNLKGLVEGQGARLDQVVKTTVFLETMDDYAEMNEIYTAFFDDHRPARSAVAVADLPIGAAVEIEAWIYTG